MEKAIGNMNYLEVLICLDEIIMSGNALEERNDDFLYYWIAWETQPKLSLDKCQFFQTSKYVGQP